MCHLQTLAPAWRRRACWTAPEWSASGHAVPYHCAAPQLRLQRPKVLDCYRRTTAVMPGRCGALAAGSFSMLGCDQGPPTWQTRQGTVAYVAWCGYYTDFYFERDPGATGLHRWFVLPSGGLVPWSVRKLQAGRSRGPRDSFGPAVGAELSQTQLRCGRVLVSRPEHLHPERVMPAAGRRIEHRSNRTSEHPGEHFGAPAGGPDRQEGGRCNRKNLVPSCRQRSRRQPAGRRWCSSES